MPPETKKTDAKKADPKKADPKKVDAKKADAKKPEVKKADSKPAKPEAAKGEAKKKAPKPSPVEVVVIERGLKLEPHQVLVRTLITEKNVGRSEKLNEYAFEVHPQAEKIDVRKAVEELFKVRVSKVRTQNRQGKARRYKNRVGTTSGWKKALVTLHPEDKINFI
jgi:large subunit ribosomal protein L23